MKATLILIGILGITIISNAQDKKLTASCVCKKKVVHHTMQAKTYKGSDKLAVTKSKHHAHKVTINNTWKVYPANACVIDSNGDIQYVAGRSYTGNYPAGISTDCDNDNLLIPRYKELTITSTAFVNNGTLPSRYTCKGASFSPPLKVTNIPEGTVSLAVIMFDPHATARKSATFWLIWNLDPDGIIPENFSTDHQSENPYNHQYGYQAACANEGTHYYHIRVYALDTKLLLNKHINKAMLENTMKGHVLAKGEIICQSNKLLD